MTLVPQPDFRRDASICDESAAASTVLVGAKDGFADLDPTRKAQEPVARALHRTIG